MDQWHMQRGEGPGPVLLLVTWWKLVIWENLVEKKKKNLKEISCNPCIFWNCDFVGKECLENGFGN